MEVLVAVLDVGEVMGRQILEELAMIRQILIVLAQHHLRNLLVMEMVEHLFLLGQVEVFIVMENRQLIQIIMKMMEQEDYPI